MTQEQLVAAVEMSPIMFGIDGSTLDWTSVDTLTMEAEILVGTFDQAARL